MNCSTTELRRFFNEEQYILWLNELYGQDAWIISTEDAWLATSAKITRYRRSTALPT
jgi:hypothetical protein